VRQDGSYDCDVLVVGGGLIGLAASVFLAQQGVRTWLVERHAAISIHPKARGVNVRSMEIYRAAGIEAAVRAAGESWFGFAIGDTLAGEYQQLMTPPAEYGGLSPTTACACDQHQIEPVLRARAAELGARLFFCSTVQHIDQDESAVTVDVASDGTMFAPPTRIRARYLVAADGAKGAIRTDLGIGRHGEPVPGTGLSVLFDADLEPAMRGRQVRALRSPAAGGLLFAGRDGRTGNWFAVPPREDLDSVDRSTLTTAVIPMIRSVVGLADFKPIVQSVMTWTTGAFVADRYRCGRILLAGDAAHVMPPYGGLGGNTGVADAHNLAWKLAAVCSGDAGDALLDTYQSERQPVAEYTVQQIMEHTADGLDQFFQRDRWVLHAIALGFRYPNGAATGGDPRPPAEDPAHPSGEPGTRAPHISLAGPVTSTLDLLDPCGFTFIGEVASPYVDALQADPLPGVRLRGLGRDDIADPITWSSTYAGSTAGLLIRPDGVISWRADPNHPDPRQAINQARNRALYRQ
jgi:putative polyketide hydroxylase